MDIQIRLLEASDAEAMAAAFTAIGWNKPVTQFRRYLSEQEQEKRATFVAFVDCVFAGYINVVWQSDYPPFRESKTPEIQDFNVLPQFRRRGIGSLLMDRAEQLVAERSGVVGIGVGLTADYGAAQRLYVLRGYVPDGRGLVSDNRFPAYGDHVRVDDGLVVHFTKGVQKGRTIKVPDITFLVGDVTRRGYMALPPNGRGAGVLVLHAWWGLTPFFKGLCDRLAGEGFVAFAPDLNHGKIAATIEEAKQIMNERDSPAVQATAELALDILRRHQAVTGGKVGAVGFSMGVAYALLLDSLGPDALSAIVMFYGLTDDDLMKSGAALLGHFGEADEWEPVEQVRELKGRDLTVHIYPGAGHWFFEDDRHGSYQREAAELAWQRTVEFLHSKVR